MMNKSWHCDICNVDIRVGLECPLCKARKQREEAAKIFNKIEYKNPPKKSQEEREVNRIKRLKYKESIKKCKKEYYEKYIKGAIHYKSKRSTP